MGASPPGSHMEKKRSAVQAADIILRKKTPIFQRLPINSRGDTLEQLMFPSK